MEDAKSLTENDRGDIKAKIESIFVLRGQAADEKIALLEIACDAAAQFADDYNYQNPTSAPIQPKWIYILVQALLAPKLKPELVNGDVPRLPEVMDTGDTTTVVDSESAGDEQILTTYTKTWQAKGTNVKTHTDNSHLQWGQDKPSLGRRSFWPDHEVKQLIWLHNYRGLAQVKTAKKLGRSLQSVNNKWAKIRKEQTWKDYMAECVISHRQGRDLSRPTTPT
ncbi:hypothetical protein N0V93_002401 [Gnomoniopsis smithogilvyi]|uniref:Uncharacterized protein n=1 Tax=Gnomoniopsis smithogilvyi TaxID=1191159 RepID=A0A9W9CZ12_9PEZI|nr:hypothetical protein N0V93_002401 [Gnomoniopsis smithogilvyi]